MKNHTHLEGHQEFYKNRFFKTSLCPSQQVGVLMFQDFFWKLDGYPITQFSGGILLVCSKFDGQVTIRFINRANVINKIGLLVVKTAYFGDRFVEGRKN